MKKLRNSELNRISSTEFKKNGNKNIVVVLDNIRSAHNVGSIMRTCDGLGISEIHLCGISATPPGKDIHKTALGAEDSVNWQYFSSTKDSIIQLKKDNYKIFSIEQTTKSKNLNEFDIGEDKIALIFGHEVKGVSNEAISLCDGAIEIPMYGTKHSFNVSVSAGIVLWELTR